jgi:hypothetical protein
VTTFGTLVRSDLGLFSISDHLVQIVSHHDSVLLDQAVWDALGSESWAVRRQVAFDTSHRMLQTITKNLGIDAPAEILDLAQELFSALGFGQLRFFVNATGGEIVGEGLLFGAGFVERYGRELKVKHRMDAFAAGYGAAAASLAFPSDWGSFEADETSCVAKGDEVCTFALARRPEALHTTTAVTRMDAKQLAGSPDERASQADLDVTAQAAALAFVLGSSSNEQGVLKALGGRLALMPVTYRAQLVFDTIHLIEKRSPALAPLFSTLVREASQTSAYMIIGELSSSAIIRENLAPTLTPEDRAARYAGLASALGWGSFTVTEFVPHRRLVLAAQLTPEAVYYATRHGGAPRAEMPCFQGIAAAIALLASSPDQGPMTMAGYAALQKTGPRVRIEETRSLLRGDADCEALVELIPAGFTS